VVYLNSWATFYTQLGGQHSPLIGAHANPSLRERGFALQRVIAQQQEPRSRVVAQLAFRISHDWACTAGMLRNNFKLRFDSELINVMPKMKYGWFVCIE
jgi:hypothetical protein